MFRTSLHLQEDKILLIIQKDQGVAHLKLILFTIKHYNDLTMVYSSYVCTRAYTKGRLLLFRLVARLLDDKASSSAHHHLRTHLRRHRRVPAHTQPLKLGLVPRPAEHDGRRSTQFLGRQGAAAGNPPNSAGVEARLRPAHGSGSPSSEARSPALASASPKAASTRDWTAASCSSSLVSFSSVVAVARARVRPSLLRVRGSSLHRRLLVMVFLSPLTMQGEWAISSLITCMQVNAVYRQRKGVVISNVKLIGCLIKRPIDGLLTPLI